MTYTVESEVARLLATTGVSEWETSFHAEYAEDNVLFSVHIMSNEEVRQYYRNGGVWEYVPCSRLFFDYHDYMQSW